MSVGWLVDCLVVWSISAVVLERVFFIRWFKVGWLTGMDDSLT